MIFLLFLFLGNSFSSSFHVNLLNNRKQNKMENEILNFKRKFESQNDLIKFTEPIIFNGTYFTTSTELKQSSEDHLSVINCQFAKCNNQHDSGGAITARILHFDCVLSSFSSCTAALGGAIYMTTDSISIISNCCFYKCSATGMYHTFFIYSPETSVSGISMHGTRAHSLPYMSGLKDGKMNITLINSSYNHIEYQASLMYIQIPSSSVNIYYCVVYNTTALTFLHYTKLSKTIDVRIYNWSIISNTFIVYPLTAYTPNSKSSDYTTFLIKECNFINNTCLHTKALLVSRMTLTVVGCYFDCDPEELFNLTITEETNGSRIRIPTLAMSRINCFDDVIYHGNCENVPLPTAEPTLGSIPPALTISCFSLIGVIIISTFIAYCYYQKKTQDQYKQWIDRSILLSEQE